VGEREVRRLSSSFLARASVYRTRTQDTDARTALEAIVCSRMSGHFRVIENKITKRSQARIYEPIGRDHSRLFQFLLRSPAAGTF
jgi:hypothetical protein